MWLSTSTASACVSSGVSTLVAATRATRFVIGRGGRGRGGRRRTRRHETRARLRLRLHLHLRMTSSTIAATCTRRGML